MAVEVITASAGSGKTTEIARRICQALAEGSARPPGVIAMTFTRRAACELAEAVTSMLLAAGRVDEVRALSSATMGTVNAVCDRLVRRFAFELGLSPNLRVIPELESHTLLAASVADVLEEEPQASQLRASAGRLQLDVGRRTWMADLEAIVHAARQNALGAGALQESADRSRESLLALLDPVHDDESESLGREVHEVLQYLIAHRGARKITSDAIETLERAARELPEKKLAWADLASLAALEAGAEHRERLTRLRSLAAGVTGHPGLRDDLEVYVRTLFHLASRGLSAYEQYKCDHRLVDFIDQERLALRALDEPACAASLGRELDLLVVDEFQDTSPLQLAIYMKLRQMAAHTVLVGDPKQAIYGFRGADPALTERCASVLGGERRALTRSYRSRPLLVDFTSRVFGCALGSDAHLTPARSDAVEFVDREGPPPLGVWLLEATNKQEDAEAVAAGIAALLSDSTASVIDKASGRARPLRPDDVAVLCARNDDIDTMAQALTAAGVPTSVGRPGLRATIEGQLAECALRLLVDPSDTMAAALLSWHEAEQSPYLWLEGRPPSGASPIIAALEAVRPSAAAASPAEALDLALDAIDAWSLCRRMSGASQRIANLQSLLGLATAYENTCITLDQPATSAGFLSHLARLASAGCDEQARVMDAVQVVTYHASKGLEWPVVVLTNLDRKPRLDPFELEVVSDEADLDPETPLRGRWIRLWVSPFGARSRDLAFVERARASKHGQAWASRVTAQDARLLYVGMTRARDCLVFAVRETRAGPAARWLQSRVTLPSPCNDSFHVHGVQVRAQRWRPMPNAERNRPHVWFAQSGPLPARPPARVQARSLPLTESERGRMVALGAIEFEGVSDHLRKAEDPEALGLAVHAFLAADPGPTESREARQALAERLLIGFRQQDVVSADDVVAASDRLFDFIVKRHPDARWHREMEVAFRHGEQEVHGVADLLLECPDGWVVIDHKTYPGPPYLWKRYAQDHVAQLEAYARAVEKASGKRVIERWLHFPLGGGVLQVVAD